MKNKIENIYSKKIFRSIHGYPTKIKSITLFAKLWFRKRINIIRYGSAGPDPFKIIYVNPEEIEKISSRKVPSHKSRFEDLGKIKGGNWDKKDIAQAYVKNEKKKFYNFYFKPYFSKSCFFKSLERRFKKKEPWENTSYYDYCESKKEINTDKRLNNIDLLFRSIKEAGFKSKTEIENDLVLDRLDDIMVDINRNGEFMFIENRHRLAIARILGIEKIPVRVVCRHKKWQEKRFQAANTEEKNKKFEDHPDLQNLL